MCCAFRDVADYAGFQRNSFAINSQAAGAFDDVADHVFVRVVDLFRVGILARFEGDQAAGELFPGEAVGVANLVVEMFEALKNRANLSIGARRHGTSP